MYDQHHREILCSHPQDTEKKTGKRGQHDRVADGHE
jgi:hypothetical protein